MARCSALLLLLLLWAGALRGAQEGPPSADLTGGSDPLDLLLSSIGRIVRSAVEPPIAGLDGRLTSVQVQLNSVRSELEDRIESAETKLEARVESAETKLETRVESAQKQVEARVESAQKQLEARVESAETKLEDRVESAETKLEARVESAQKQLEARVESAETKLEDRVESAETKLEARVESAQTKLEARVESAKTKLEARVESAQKQLETRMDGIHSEQAAQTLEQTGRLSQIESALQGVQSQLEARLEGVQSQLESRLEEVQSQQRPVRDCSDLPAGATSGVHLLQPGLRQLVPAYCDQQTDGGGWTIIQRRADIQPRQNFSLGWAAYKWGFGELDSEFWWGLENLWLTTSLLDRRYQIRIDMEDFDGEKRYAVYQGFKVASEEDGYRLTTSNYTGNAGDSLDYHSGQRFSTKGRDQDQEEGDCAEVFKGGWWYKSCHHANLNGLYLVGNHSSSGRAEISWYHWRGHDYSLKSVEMKIKPSKKL